MPSSGKIDATYAPGKGKLEKEYSEPLAARTFPRQGTHGSYAVDGSARTRFVYFSKNKSWPLEKAKSRQQKNNEQRKQGAQRSAQRRGHTAQHTLQLPGNTVYSAPSVGCGVLSDVVSKAYVKNVRKLSEVTTPARYKRHEKEQTARRASVGPNK